MKNILFKTLLSIATIFFFTCSAGAVFCDNHMKELDSVRTSLSELGTRMPELIKNSKPQDLRTLERVFEINNYALVTIESYLKMIKITLTSGGTVNKETIGIMNSWLKFIDRYCEYDLKYFAEAMSEVKDEKVLSVLSAQKNNIVRLREISAKGVGENNDLLKVR